jgi:hypothetical protein
VIKSYHCKGIRKAGEMNGIETRYSLYLEELRISGKILYWRYEAINLRVCKDAWYRPDFLVMTADGTLEVHEIKGAKAVFEQAAKLRVKMAADQFPFRFVVVFPKPKKDGGGWEFVPFTDEEDCAYFGFVEGSKK